MNREPACRAQSERDWTVIPTLANTPPSWFRSLIAGTVITAAHWGLAQEVLLPNGDFEAGWPIPGFTSSGVNGGFGGIVQEGTCWSYNNTSGITLSGNWAASVRSSGPAPTSSIGILTSDLFYPGETLSFEALSENDILLPLANPVSFEVRILNASWTVLHAEPIQTNVVTLFPGYPCTNLPVDEAFSTHIIDTSPFCGQPIRVQFRQHTNAWGRGWFTLVDDVRVNPGNCDLDGDGVADFLDDCPNSDLRPTVHVGPCDSGVSNRMRDAGCSLADLLAFTLHECADGARNHGQFISCFTQAMNEFQNTGVISGAENGALTNCAAQLNLP